MMYKCISIRRTLEIIKDTLVKISSDRGACYRVKKCAEVFFKEGENDEKKRIEYITRENEGTGS